MDLLECVQRKAKKVIQGMEYHPSEDRLGDLGLISLEKRGSEVTCERPFSI